LIHGSLNIAGDWERAMDGDRLAFIEGYSSSGGLHPFYPDGHYKKYFVSIKVGLII